MLIIGQQGISGTRYTLSTTHLKYETLVSILLAAQMAERKVQLRFDGCTTNGQGQIIGVYLK